jgi:hypothetical protein
MPSKEYIKRNKVIKEALEFVQTALAKKSFSYPHYCQSSEERHEFIRKKLLSIESFGAFDKGAVEELIEDLIVESRVWDEVDETMRATGTKRVK